ncbi:hypothetical protein BY458DRAFT_445239 [Sporodiniella umbellata]|nr:hypothetical protein BY458DRAFT_445239 [Sporodiniella umbellata]
MEPSRVSNLSYVLQSIYRDENWHGLLESTIKTAEKELNVHRYVEVESLLDTEYHFEPKVILYVSELCNARQQRDFIESEEQKSKRLQDIFAASQYSLKTPKPKRQDEGFLNRSLIIPKGLHYIDPLAADLFDNISDDVILKIKNASTQQLSVLDFRLLVLRLRWEQSFVEAVEWLSNAHLDLSQFITTAHWCGEEALQTENNVENIIQSLVELESQISDFDKGTYCEILDFYHQMEDLSILPDHMKSRQNGFESAFEDLLKQADFGRKIVEQLLSIVSIIEKFQQSLSLGEELKDEMSSDAIQMDKQEQNLYSDKIQSFKQQSVLLIQSAMSSIPHPALPDMKTVMRTNDLYMKIEMAKETITCTINSYSVSLSLLVESLDQLIDSRHHVIYSQQKLTEAQNLISTIQFWLEEKITSVVEFDLNPALFTYLPGEPISSLAIPLCKYSLEYSSHINEQELNAIEKECEQTLDRIVQIENEDLVKLENAVQQLRNDLHKKTERSLDILKTTHQSLKRMLFQRGLQINALQQRFEWETKWSKYHGQLITLAKKICEFNVKKARYDPTKENTDMPTYKYDRELTQPLQWMQDRLGELNNRPWESLLKAYQNTTKTYLTLLETSDESALPNFITLKQSDIKEKKEDLKQLFTYTSDLITQRTIIVEFLIRAKDAYRQGEKIKDSLSKCLRRINENDNNQSIFDERVKFFKHNTKTLWSECGENMPYPVYGGNWLRQHSNEAAGTYRAYLRTQIKSLLENKMQDLITLENSIDHALSAYQEAKRIKLLAIQYGKEADDLQNWINEHIEKLKAHSVEVAAEFVSECDIGKMEKFRKILWKQVEIFEHERVKPLHDRVVSLLETSVASNQLVDTNVTVGYFGNVIGLLDRLKQEFSDQAVVLKAMEIRTTWENNLKNGISCLENMNEILLNFSKKNGLLLTQEELNEKDVYVLESELTELIILKADFEKTTLTDIRTSYDAFIDCFLKLPKPMAAPDHLEIRMVSFEKHFARLEELVETLSKEHEYTRNKFILELNIGAALDNVLKTKANIDHFVEHKARWDTTKTLDTTFSVNSNNEESLHKEWQQIDEEVEKYEHQTLVSIELQMKKFLKNTYNNSYLAPLQKKIENLKTVISRTKDTLLFSKDVVSQHCLISAFLSRSAQLEQSAELLRKEFATENNLEKHTISLFETQYERLNKFKTSIEDVKHQLAPSIPYPTRIYPADTKICDDAVNFAICKIIDMKSIRLNELQLGLEEALTTRERICDLHSSLKAFKKQAYNTESWIQDQSKVLERHLKMMYVDMPEEALSHFRNVQRVMNANENNFTSLSSVYEACNFAFSNKHLIESKNATIGRHLVDDYTHFVKPKYIFLKEMWENLAVDIKKAQCNKNYLMVSSKLEAWLKSAEDLVQCTLIKMDEATVSLLKDWQHQITDLERLGAQYGTELEALENLLDTNMYQKLSKVYHKGLEATQEISSQILQSQKKVELAQMVDESTRDAKLLLTEVHDYFEAAKNFKCQYKSIITISSIAQKNQGQRLISDYKKLQDTIAYLKNSYSCSNLQLKAILKEKIEYETSLYTALEKAWLELLSYESDIDSLFPRALLWNQSLSDLLDTGISVNKIEGNLKSVLEYHELEMLSQQIAAIIETFSHGLYIFSPELVNDKNNMGAYKKLHSESFENALRIEKELSKKAKHFKKTNLIDHVQKCVRETTTVCISQTNAIKNSSMQGIWLDNWQENIDLYLNEYQKTLETSKEAMDRSCAQLNNLKSSQCQELISAYSYNDAHLLTTPLVESINSLNEEIINGEYQLSFCKKAFRLTVFEKLVVDRTSSLTTASLEGKSPVAVTEIENFMDFLVEQELGFTALSNSIDIDRATFTEDTKREIKQYIEKCQKSINQNISEAKRKGQDIVSSYEKNSNSQRILSKLEELAEFTNCAIKKLQKSNSDKSCQSLAEFDILCHQYRGVIHTKETELQELIPADISATEKLENMDFKDAFENKKKLVDTLDKLIEDKRHEKLTDDKRLQTEELLKEFELEISMLDKAIESASPKNIDESNEKSIKSSLQSMLRSLIDSYKHHHPKTVHLLDQIHKESKMHSLDTRNRLDQWLVYGKKKAATVRTNAVLRERELQTFINQLNTEFFKNLATSRTRHVLPPAPYHPPYKKSKEHALIEESKSLSTVPSSLSKCVGNIETAKKNSIPPSLDLPSKRDAYIPDPKNALDVELSNIVNASPNRVTIKMIPGEVGKYWFGDTNPRLVYCRILPSQMVMVRVGGGWVELSKFLRDHGLSEGNRRTVEKPSNSTQNHLPFQQSYLETRRSPSSFEHNGARSQSNTSSVLTSTSSSSTNSRSPLPGYLEGSKFFSTNEAGKNFVATLKKAENDAKAPLFNKKS